MLPIKKKLLLFYIKVAELFSEKENVGFIDFLTGFRGSMALSVILEHSSHEGNNTYQAGRKELFVFYDIGFFYGVINFFILSSFLLTYRLLSDFSKTNGSPQQIIIVIMKYFIRRFFRIYVPFVIFTTSVIYVWPKLGGHDWFHYPSWTSLVTLQKSGQNFLWTIAPEIKYYFFQPVFTLFMYKISSRKNILSWFYLAAFILLTVFVDETNFLNLKYEDMDLFERGYKFLTRFSVFFKVVILICFKYLKSIRYNKYLFSIGFISSRIVL